MNKTDELGSVSVGKLLAKYSIPAVIAMIVNAIYNVIDRIFIGQYVGEEALAALTIVFPIMMLTFALAALIGAGAGSLMSIKLGEKNIKSASHVFGNALTLSFLISIISIIGIYFNMDIIMVLFGASEDLIPMAKSYTNIILVGFLFQMFAFTFNNTVRVEGNPMIPMKAMIISAVTNIILDYIFIAIFNWGVNGAALATITGQIIGFFILLSFYIKGNSSLDIDIKDLKPDVTVIREIFTIGFSSFIGTVGMSLAMTFMNRSLITYGGTAAITSMGAINSLFTIFIMPIMGLQQGMQPIVGYNYGARLLDRSYSTLKIALIVSTLFSTVVFVLLQFFPQIFIGMFLDPTSTTMGVAITGMRYYMLMLPLLGVSFLGGAFFQATGMGKTAMILSLLRQFIILIPLVLILPTIWGLTGVWLATPLADVSSIIITIVALIYTKKRNKDSMVTEVIKQAV